MRGTLLFGSAVLLTAWLATAALADAGIGGGHAPGPARPGHQVTLSCKFVQLQGRDERDFGIDFTPAQGAGTPGVLLVRGALSTETLRVLLDEGRAQLLNEPRVTLDDGAPGELDFSTKLGYHPPDQEAGVMTFINVQGTLKVTPHVVGEDNGTGEKNVKVTLDLTVPDGLGLVGGGGLPAEGVATFREVKAEITLHDGQTLVIGGLPRQDTPAPDGSELVVFITPQIVRERPPD